MNKNFLRLVVMLITLFTLPSYAGDARHFYMPLFGPSDPVAYVSPGSDDGTAIPLLGQGWARYETDGDVRLTLENGISTPANQPAMSFNHPWVRLTDGHELSLTVFNPSSGTNVVWITGQIADGSALWQEIGIAPLGDAELQLPQGLMFLRVDGSEPLVSYLFLKGNGRTVWIDRGESAPLNQGGQRYALVVDGAAAAVEVEVQAEQPLVERPTDLSDSVSMTWHATNNTVKAVWVSPDLRPFPPGALGFVYSASGAEPHLVNSIASDSEGNRAEVKLRLQGIQ